MVLRSLHKYDFKLKINKKVTRAKNHTVLRFY